MRATLGEHLLAHASAAYRAAPRQRRARAGEAGCSRAAPRRGASVRARLAPGATRASRSGRAASSAARRRRGAAPGSAGSARAPRAAPAATRSPPPSAATMSSLRRRAIWITRARSTWRSSIGGRASARTTAAASCGSASRRIQASTSRTSARSRKRRSGSTLGRPACAARPWQVRTSSGDTCRTRGRAGRSGGAGQPGASEPLIEIRHRQRGYALDSGTDAIDWGAAQRVGELIAGSPPYRGRRAPRRSSRSRTTSRGASAPTAASSCPRELPPLEIVDRPGWIAANLKTMRPLLDAAHRTREDDSDGAAAGLAGLVCGPLRAASGLPARRAGGGADGHALPARARPVRPRAARRRRCRRGCCCSRRTSRRPRATSGVDRDELVAVGDDPRDHPRRPVLRRAVAARAPRGDAQRADRRPAGDARPTIHGMAVAEQGRPATARRASGCQAGRVGGPGVRPDGELRELLERARRGELLRLTLGDERWQLVERMQATMSLIEGHAEHTMDAVGAEVLPSLPRLRAAMNRRRETPRAALAGARAAARTGAEAAPVRGRQALLRRGRRGRGLREALAPAWRRPGAAAEHRGAREPARG